MTKEDATGWINALIKAMHEETSGSWPDPEYKDEVYSALEMAIRTLENHDIFMKRAYSQGKQDALSQEPCDDAISREELLKAIDTWDKFGYTETGCFVREPKGDYVAYIHYDDVIKCINGMPSVNPQPICEEREKGECPWYAG